MTAAATVRAVGLLERAIGFTRGSLALVTDPLLERPTPCADWSLRDLLTHMDDSLAAFTEAAALGRVEGLPPLPLDRAAPAALLVERLRVRACSTLGAWMTTHGDGPLRVGRGSMDASLLAAVGGLEITVHGWDVAQACGHDVPLPDELARDLEEVARLVVAPDDRPDRFADPRTPRGGEHADPGSRLLAFLGR